MFLRIMLLLLLLLIIIVIVVIVVVYLIISCPNRAEKEEKETQEEIQRECVHLICPDQAYAIEKQHPWMQCMSCHELCFSARHEREP